MSKWIKHKCADTLTRGEGVSTDCLATASMLSRWLESMNNYLLKKEWNGEEVNEWSCIVSDILTHWEEETKQKPFPKLHMLKHTV